MNEKVIITVTSCWELKSFEGVNPMDAFWKAFGHMGRSFY